MGRYFLSTHSFACETAGHAVFLDLKHDKYTAVSPEDIWALRTFVEGWPAVQPPARPPDRESTNEIVRVLMKEGLLTEDSSTGKEATPAALDMPITTFAATQRLSPPLTLKDLRNFVSAWAFTTLHLRTLPISWIVNHARRRKERKGRPLSPMDIQRAYLLTNIHLTLQPAFYSAKDACLRNSLTLVEFLAKYDIYPQWAFGVRMEPFSAHSWVQYGNVLFTDPIDHVQTFTPIMVI
jgi:hypothetical protein